MNERLAEFIADTKMGKMEFASIMGWSGQYLNTILRGSFGIVPLRKILEEFPELDARWMITGEGKMISYKAKVKNK